MAASAGSLLYFASFFPFNAITQFYGELTLTKKVAACLSSNVALALGISRLLKLELRRKCLPCKFSLCCLIPWKVGGTVGKKVRKCYTNYLSLDLFIVKTVVCTKKKSDFWKIRSSLSLHNKLPVILWNKVVLNRFYCLLYLHNMLDLFSHREMLIFTQLFNIPLWRGTIINLFSSNVYLTGFQFLAITIIVHIYLFKQYAY